MDHYRISDLENFFGVTTNTIRRWAIEFEDYLSHDANPGENEIRLFTAEDVGVLALVAQMKNERRAPFKAIHVQLQAGERGVIPEQPAAIVPSDDREKLVKMIQRLELQIESMGKEREQLREENIRLSEQVKMLREQLDNQEDTAELHQLIGRLRYEIEQLKSDGD